MANSLFKILGENKAPGQMGNLINQFNDFKKTINGDPKQQVEELLKSGKMTQEQFNELAKMANQMAGILK